MNKLDNPLIIGRLLFGLLFAGVLSVSGQKVTAQELLVPPASGPTGPPQLELPAMAPIGSGTRGPGTRGSGTGDSLPAMELPAGPTSTSTTPLAEPISSGDLQSEFQPLAMGDEYRVFDCEPALLESTGTWLRRGFWYSEVDVVLMDLVRTRDNTTLMFQSAVGGQNTTNTLFLEGGKQGSEATPRITLGRFLFRDHKNRDHTAEFIVYGGGQWSKGGRLDAVAGGTLTTTNAAFGNFTIPEGNVAFNGATSSQYDYSTRFNSFELNYHLKARMQKDRMELEPSGHWVRRAQPGISRSLIAGIRYVDLNDGIDWDAFGIDNDNLPATAPQTGNYRVRSDNDLFGTQLGFSWAYEAARWSLGVQNKSGMFLDHTVVDSRFNVTGGVTSGNNRIVEDNLSFLNEAALVGKWHLRPNFSLRAGLEILFISSVSHSVEQLNFIPVSTSQSIANSTSTFMGGMIGFEGYW